MVDAGGSSGELRRFLLEAQPLRGHHVRLASAWSELRAGRQYPPSVDALLGETVAAATLLAATLKFSGKLTLQLKGNGLVPLLVAQCTHDFQIRGTASCDKDVAFAESFQALVGNGQLVVTIETGQEAGRYQGIVPLQAQSVAACLEDYFMQSEQLPTRLKLHCHADVCSGLLLQKLPAQSEGEAAAAITQSLWEELEQSLSSLPAGALHLDTERLLPQLMGAHDCRLYGASAVSCRCSCGLERVSAVLRSLGEAEARSVLAEQGSVSVRCEFCGRSWQFDAIDIARIFSTTVSADAGRQLN